MCQGLTRSGLHRLHAGRATSENFTRFSEIFQSPGFRSGESDTLVWLSNHSRPSNAKTLHARLGHLDGPAAVSLLSDRELDTLALGQRDPRLLLADDEDVALPGSERVVNSVLDVDNVEATVVSLTVGDDANTTHVTTTSDHGDHTSVEADELGDLSGGEVDLNGVVDLDRGIGVSDTISHPFSFCLCVEYFQPNIGSTSD